MLWKNVVVFTSTCYKAVQLSLFSRHNNQTDPLDRHAKSAVTYFCSSGSSVCSWTMAPLHGSQTCTQASTQERSVALLICMMYQPPKGDQWSNKTNLILQINERRAPILIRADDCWLSFFTVPVLRSNILPCKSQKDQMIQELHQSHFFWERNHFIAKRHLLSVYFYTCAVIFRSWQLLPELFCVVRVELIIEWGAQPVRLQLVEDGCQGVWDVNNAASLTWDHKQEAIGRLQYEMFQFLWRHGIVKTSEQQQWIFKACHWKTWQCSTDMQWQFMQWQVKFSGGEGQLCNIILLLCPGYMYLISEEGRFVRAISVGVAASSQRFHVRHSHSQDGQFVWFPRQCAAGGNHVGQLCDVGGHLVPPPPLNLTVIFSDGQTQGEERRKGGIEMGGRNRRAGGQHGVELKVNVAMSRCLLGGGSGNESGEGWYSRKRGSANCLVFQIQNTWHQLIHYEWHVTKRKTADKASQGTNQMFINITMWI